MRARISLTLFIFEKFRVQAPNDVLDTVAAFCHSKITYSLLLYQRKLDLRLQKRRNAVARIKSTPEYTNAQHHDPSERPTTPIPSLSFSKREWEKVAMEWRQALKDMPPAAAFSSSSSDCTTSIECSSVSDI